MGLPVPQALFYVDPENRNLVIDGLQLIMSVVYFFDGYFGEETYQGKKTVFRLTGLSEKSPYAKKTFSDLTDSDKRKLRNRPLRVINRSEEHTSELQSLMRTSYAVFCLKKKTQQTIEYKAQYEIPHKLYQLE